jgi:hypothetical protein
MKKYLILIFIILYTCACQQEQAYTGYYLGAVSHNDKSDGTKKFPWTSLTDENKSLLKAGDTLYIGVISPEKVVTIDFLKGEKGLPIVIKGVLETIVMSGNNSGIHISNSQHLLVEDLHLKGSGRKGGNTHDGLLIYESKNITVNNVEAEGYQKSGIHIKSSKGIIIDNSYAHDNGFCGIYVSGKIDSKVTSRDIIIRNSKAENNPGDPTNLTNHSGNGILAGHCTNVTIEYCTATNNGWDMPRVGNGPVGIWAYEADSVLIQYCISYKNKTSAGAKDGGGFDLDGGITNSIIQYCLSYDNEGSGYGLFQYSGASPWSNNMVRFCISENDGNTSNGMGGIFVWSNTGDPEQLINCIIYNNTIYNAHGGSICYDIDSGNKNFYYYNNIFVGKDDLVKGVKELPSNFIANNWYSLDNKGFNIGGIRNFEEWAKKNGKEQMDGKIVGLNIDPQFKNPGRTSLTDPKLLQSYDAYKLPENSVLRNKGFDFLEKYNIKDSPVDINGNKTSITFMGAIY